MSVIHDLLTITKTEASDHDIREAWVGIHFTGVWSRKLGLATTQFNVPCCFATDIVHAGQIQECSALELTGLLSSKNPLEVSVGMAAFNSMTTINLQDGIEVNAKSLLIERGRDKNVAMIGHFGFTEQLREAAKKLWVLELDPAFGDTPADQAPDILPQADVIGLTATTIINHTFDNLSKLFPAHALVMMLGPTTPLTPVLFDHGIDVLAGSIVDDPLKVLHLIGQGSPLHRPQGLKRFTMVRDPNIIS